MLKFQDLSNGLGHGIFHFIDSVGLLPGIFSPSIGQVCHVANESKPFSAMDFAILLTVLQHVRNPWFLETGKTVS